MRHFPTRALVLIALATPLGACSSFLGIHFAHHVPRAAPEAGPALASAAGQPDSATSVGRRQLAEGQTGLAIESFQRAMAGGEPIAPAVNGLGVAYARLGRFDLAQRYFQQALASDPVNTLYADNLARLMRSSALVMRRDEDIARAALQAAALLEAGEAKPGQVANAAPVVGKLQRISRGEVRIATAAPQAAPVSSHHAAVDSRFKPLVRIMFAELSPARSQAPIRIVLPEPKPADAPSVATAVKADVRR